MRAREARAVDSSMKDDLASSLAIERRETTPVVLVPAIVIVTARISSPACPVRAQV